MQVKMWHPLRKSETHRARIPGVPHEVAAGRRGGQHSPQKQRRTRRGRRGPRGGGRRGRRRATAVVVAGRQAAQRRHGGHRATAARVTRPARGAAARTATQGTPAARPRRRGGPRLRDAHRHYRHDTAQQRRRRRRRVTGPAKAGISLRRYAHYSERRTLFHTTSLRSHQPPQTSQRRSISVQEREHCSGAIPSVERGDAALDVATRAQKDDRHVSGYPGVA